MVMAVHPLDGGEGFMGGNVLARVLLQHTISNMGLWLVMWLAHSMDWMCLDRICALQAALQVRVNVRQQYSTKEELSVAVPVTLWAAVHQ